MRLRTQIQDGKLFCLGNAFYELGSDKGIDCIAQDAFYAHALVQAIKEHFTALNFNYVQGEDDVSRRADELLREWGWEVPDVGS